MLFGSVLKELTEPALDCNAKHEIISLVSGGADDVTNSDSNEEGKEVAMLTRILAVSSCGESLILTLPRSVLLHRAGSKPKRASFAQGGGHSLLRLLT